MNKVRSNFPVLRQYIYANTAAFGLFSDDLLDWRQEYDLDFLLKGSAMRKEGLKIIEETRESVASLFHCKSDDVALVSNFSLGINMVLDSLKEGSKIALLENDYPSVKWPFETRSFKTFEISITAQLEEDIENLIAKENIDVLALSIVQWLNGVKIDLDFIKKLKKENPELLIIADGTQFCGTSDFNFQESGIDILGASAYKWLLSGYGNGFFLFNEAVKDRLAIPIIGFSSAGAEEEKKDSISFVKHFEPGHLSCFAFGSLNFSLNYMKSIGIDKIETRIKVIAAKAILEFSKLGLLDEVVVQRKEHSTIFNIKGDSKLFNHLTDNGVICSQRGDGIRLSFHFYNTEKDIEDIIKVIKSVI
ncbi:aminotransferase class V-fold PLP-dependent enzyme [uncultured Maribacter sp.]|uniref:aminotransferase class V-fold PLP-dependent enzyme n=1 Tax=uncultured Maribacter sp. TaxID=431308 RepID=UPI00262C9822|nr:aminotransferase class V-fold PLP-dependent enzyme [uncultured Maribacter sp.]